MKEEMRDNCIGGNEYPTWQAPKLTRSQLFLNAEARQHWLL